MSDDEVPERLMLGVGGLSMLVPPGWEAVGLDRSALEEDDIDPTGELVAAGVSESAGGFAANVMVLRGGEAIDVPATEFDDGLVWHDTRSDGVVQRVTIGVSEFLLTSIATVRLWATAGDDPVLVVATVDCDSLPAKWPTVAAVLRSMFDGQDVPWERWF